MIAHIIINLILQPFSFRQMRAELFKVRTDIVAQMVVEGEFITPLQGLTVYARRVEANGRLTDVIIYDARDTELPNMAAITQTAKSGEIQRAGEKIALRLRNGAVQKLLPDGSLDIVEFEDYIVDLTELTRSDHVFRLKASDRYIHELFKPDPADVQDIRRRNEYLAEAHARLATPLYSPALALLALCFLIRGQHQRMGYGRKIALCAGLGFILRIAGFGLTSAAEASPALNAAQYGLPFGIILICVFYLLSPRKMGRARASSVEKF
jgi:lipopolysaccharide export system permease protein